MLYTPYIEGAMEYINRIYSWNNRVDEMRKTIHNEYDFNAGLKMFYEEKNEYTEAKLANDIEEQVDALIDQFIVAIGEIRKCSLADDYQHIDFWEDKSYESYSDLLHCINGISLVEGSIWEEYVDEKNSYSIRDRAITEVLGALDTRFGADCYVNNEGKFIKSTDYRKPDLSFLKN